MDVKNFEPTQSTYEAEQEDYTIYKEYRSPNERVLIDNWWTTFVLFDNLYIQVVFGIWELVYHGD